MSCGVGRRRSLDPTLLWLWCRPAAAAPIRPLAWDPPCAAGAALKRPKKYIVVFQKNAQVNIRWAYYLAFKGVNEHLKRVSVSNLVSIRALTRRSRTSEPLTFAGVSES